ncbi:MAG TPA: twin-arginine translocase TatA/TatE family subunit [Planctomycetaceae bacterium]|nr:twin-arginine translocase TatA/TatE family subunit [Gimesia maris]HAW31218.1 twin-arginine translocase TatA/TatE family subunit [Planctomycetaceae bacterium]HCO25079.1 twin-arginine translocase TatA/TatE family subunit [Gimesia maris]
MPGGYEMIIVGIIALLLFGKRLPEVARSLGKGIVEFKKGVSGIEDEVNQASYSHSQPETPRPTPSERSDEFTAPKFEVPSSEPKSEEKSEQA